MCGTSQDRSNIERSKADCRVRSLSFEDSLSMLSAIEHEEPELINPKPSTVAPSHSATILRITLSPKARTLKFAYSFLVVNKGMQSKWVIRGSYRDFIGTI